MQAPAEVPADERWLHPNLVVDVPGAAAFAEDGWDRIDAGDGAVLAPWVKEAERCRMLNVVQDDLPGCWSAAECGSGPVGGRRPSGVVA